MVKAGKYFRKEAIKAERVASRVSDPEISAEMRAMADAYRGQADALKKQRQKKKLDKAALKKKRKRSPSQRSRPFTE